MAIAAQALAGLVHMMLTPEHMMQALGVGLFFLAMGSAQVAWAVVRLRHTGRVLDDAGILLAASSMAVYLLSRTIGDPFSGDPEGLEFFGIYTQVLQAAAVACLLAVGSRSWRYALTVLAAGILLGGAMYGLGLGASQLFPGLGQSHMHSH